MVNQTDQREQKKIKPTINLNDRNAGLHLISPYVGKIRPVLARHLIRSYANPKSIIYDPFCGSGTVPFEAWSCGNKCFATDLNEYAITLTKGKLQPYKSLESALSRLDWINSYLNRKKSSKKNRKVPKWVSCFFHPRTLSEVLMWSSFLQKRKEWFLISCLLGILHHQRPGFLSFPSSHGAPYLRGNKYPKNKFPELYEYREVYPRLRAKVTRAYKNLPTLDHSIQRIVRKASSENVQPPTNRIHTIITSPPYMKSLTYARDNRLRLWFLGKTNWEALEKIVSPTKKHFSRLMSNSFNRWKDFQKKGDYCIVIIGDIPFDKKIRLPEFIITKAEENGYRLDELLQDPIPDSKRFNKLQSQIVSESILIFSRRD